MNKIAAYLNEHLSGVVLTNSQATNRNSTDGSVLAKSPEMVAVAAESSDIRKILRFCSQLAEKGHVVTVTARGLGGDPNGGATGKGIVVDQSKHLNHIVGVDPRQKLVHVQAGILHSAVNAALSTHRGLRLPNIAFDGQDGTIGGVVSAGSAGSRVGIRHSLAESLQQLEVILSSGEVLQTQRLTKRELSRKKGLTTLEGDIYRKIDNLLNDNKDLISRLATAHPETIGYSGITKVRAKDGSFNLAPLFFGAQGNLGIISELIVKADFVRPDATVVVAAYDNLSDAQSAIDIALSTRAAAVNLIDGRLFERAAKEGKKISWAPEPVFGGAVLLAVFDDFSDRNRSKLAKRLARKLSPTKPIHLEQLSIDTVNTPELYMAVTIAGQPSATGLVVPTAFTGGWLPLVQLDAFKATLRAVEEQNKLDLPIFYDATTGLVNLYPRFDVQKVSERQKILKVISDLATAFDTHSGSFTAAGGEGRLKASFVYKQQEPEALELFRQIKEIFDPFGIFGDSVKQIIPAKELAGELNDWSRRHLA